MTEETMSRAADVGRPSEDTTIIQSRHWEVITGIGAFALRRVAFGIVVLLAVIFLSYLGLSMARGNELYPALSKSASETVSYIARLARGELGRSRAASVTQASVTVLDVLPGLVTKSLGLLAAALGFATVVAVPLGIWAASRRRSGWSLLTILVSIIGVSVPSFFAALLLQLGAIRLTRLLGHRVLPVGGFGWDRHLILPALVLAARPIAQIYRVTYVTISDILEQDYVRTARSKGLRELLVMGRHVVRNAAIPILTTVGLSLRFSLSSLPVVEFFFGWPGVGYTLLKSISKRDDNLTVILALCLGVFFILVNLVLEILYRFIDPRLRDSNGRKAEAEREGIVEGLRSLVTSVLVILRDNPITRLFRPGEEEDSESPFRAVLEERGQTVDVSPAKYRAERIRFALRATLTNIPFIIGVLVLGLLLVVFIWGPEMAPHSPYTTQSLVYEDGELSVPPFEPSEVHPWGTDVLGRDIMSLVLAGAQQTLLLAILVVAARIAVGFVLGAIAGWWSGSWIDRFLMGLSETLAAFPTLLLAMTFILALGIREGVRPFVIALCLVGWGEVMQFVRGEVMSIRPKLYVESAVALGLTAPRIIVSHVLPNLLSSLISITSLEMGAVLMLLGELGFVGIFIGGGAFAELDTFSAPYHYSDVPEWGAMLSNVRRYARSYSWMAIYPSFAFFVAILGFNLLGEGIRRLVESIGVVINRLVNRYTIAAVALSVVGITWVQANTGSTAFYQRQAKGFDGERAYEQAKILARPSFDGRALGTDGMSEASQHIAEQLDSLGIQAAGEDMTYFQSRLRSFEQLDAVPRLEINDGGSPLVYHQDFVEYVSPGRNVGRGEGQIRFVALGPVTRSGAMITSYKGLEELDFSGDILLAVSEGEADLLRRVPCAGILIIGGDDQQFDRRRTLSSRDPHYLMFGTGEARGQDIPRLWITESIAERLLADTGYTVNEVRNLESDLDVNEVFDLATGVRASMEVQGTVRERVPVQHVLGSWTGRSDSRYGGINDQMVVIMAQYDTPPVTPDERRYPGANDNASGVAVMLEALRAMKASGYQPYRTFLIVAYTAEGQEGGEWVSPVDVERFLEAKKGFSSSFDIEAVVDLRGLGAGDGGGLVISSGGSMRLADLLERSANRMGVRSRRGGESVDISIVFEEKSRQARGQEAPKVGLSWDGWKATSCRPDDTVASLSADNLEEAGRVVTLALMTLGREFQY